MRHRYCSRLIFQSFKHHSKSTFPTQNRILQFHSLRYQELNQQNPTKSHIPNAQNFNVKSSNFTTLPVEAKPPAPSKELSSIVDEISGLTLLEVSDLTEVLRKKLGIEEMPVMTMMMPGMAFGGSLGAKGKSGGAAAKTEVKAEKTAFDLKLEGGFDAAVKIKIIKEVRAFTNLGLKEAKELVEKAPTLLKKGVSKEEADKIVEKMKEVGAKVTVE